MAKKDLLIRSLSGVIFLAVLVSGIILLPALLPYILIICLYFMFNEFLGISLKDGYKTERALALVAGIMLFVMHYLVRAYNLDSRWMFVTVIPFTAMMISLVLRKDKSDYEQSAWLFESILYIAVPFALIPYLVIRNGYYDGRFLFSFMCLLCTSDVGAYCIGTLFGQKPGAKKLAPHISPKKSWIGLWGGLFFTVAVSLLLNAVGLLAMPWLHCAILATLLSLAGVCGDLFESVWKRHFGVKDSGNSIPGHGGFLDRFDSWLFALPVAALYISIFDLL